MIMPSASVFRWMDGGGWLVLAPGSVANSDIRALALARVASGRLLACALVNGDSDDSDKMLEDLEELGAPTGYLVDLVAEDDETVESKLRDASIVVVESAASLRAAKASLTGAAERGIRAAYETGAVVLIEGLSAVFFGRLATQEDGQAVVGLGWLVDSVIVPTAQDLSTLVKPVLQTHSHLYAVGIGAGTALALGPNGEVEVWGARQIAVTLGQVYCPKP
jgi:hypothetical protein